MTQNEILQQLDQINPLAYTKSRNFTNGAVTRLSPYISRGVIDTKTILEHLIQRGFKFNQLEKFVQQMAWREYFQRVWQGKGNEINHDLKNDQEARFHAGMPLAVYEANTGIEAIDRGIRELKSKGNMHNHMRMYTAFLSANLASFHWADPARWMYYHLLDGDWASNALSWQWVAGTFSHKKYIANQDNINHYAQSTQKRTYLDVEYDALLTSPAPEVLLTTCTPDLATPLPSAKQLVLNPGLPTLVYNYYNLSPTWRKDEHANRVLLLEPKVFEEYPVSKACIDFALKLSENIEGIQCFTGSFAELKSLAGSSALIYKEHPLNKHYSGIQDQRTWMLNDPSTAEGSFSGFWRKFETRLIKQYFS